VLGFLEEVVREMGVDTCEIAFKRRGVKIQPRMRASGALEDPALPDALESDKPDDDGMSENL
jgi:hypothetical protein